MKLIYINFTFFTKIEPNSANNSYFSQFLKLGRSIKLTISRFELTFLTCKNLTKF